MLGLRKNELLRDCREPGEPLVSVGDVLALLVVAVLLLPALDASTWLRISRMGDVAGDDWPMLLLCVFERCSDGDDGCELILSLSSSAMSDEDAILGLGDYAGPDDNVVGTTTDFSSKPAVIATTTAPVTTASTSTATDTVLKKEILFIYLFILFDFLCLFFIRRRLRT